MLVAGLKGRLNYRDGALRDTYLGFSGFKQQERRCLQGSAVVGRWSVGVGCCPGEDSCNGKYQRQGLFIIGKA